MKVIHITGYALRGGCEKNCLHFIRGATGHSHEVIVLGTQGPMTSEWMTAGATVTHLDILTHDLLSFRKLLAKFLADRKSDLVISWSTIRLPLQLNALRKVSSRIRVHLGNPLGSNYNTVKDRILQVLFPRSKNVVAIACSDYVRQSHLSSNYFRQFEIRVSLNPVDVPQSPGRQLPDGFRIGMVARLDPIKDHSTVINGFAILKKQIPEISLHLVGDGVRRTELEELVTNLQLSDVHFHGDVANVYEYLHNWHIFVYATTNLEGLGISVEEAMANAMPCVLSDQPMLRELAPTDGLVRWFRPFDARSFAMAVLELYKDREMCDHLGKRAFEHASKHFGVSRFVADYLND